MNDGTRETSKRYWRSVDRLVDSPALREQMRDLVEREFPEGASDAPDAMTRRTMLGLMGASFGLAGLTACRRPVETIVPYVNAPEDVVPGQSRYYASTMPLGTDSYGVVVESHEGRPTKVEGNELHPSSKGAANAWMQASILGLYDPDRSHHVMRRDPDSDDGSGLNKATWADFENAWFDLAPEFDANGGEGLALVSRAYCSPTMARLSRAFAARYPNARAVTWEPVGDEAIFNGLAMATGSPARPVYDLAAADTVLALDCDLLSSESDGLQNSRSFAAGRKEGSNRLYAAESALTLTGATADHRLRMTSNQVAQFAAALAGKLGATPNSGINLAEETQTKLDLIAADLTSAGANALVAAGRGHSAEVHALVYAINSALGAVGSTVRYEALTDATWSDPAALGTLCDEMRTGTVTTLVILGGNPVYDAPGDVDFGRAMRAVNSNGGTTIHHGDRVDETSELASWHLPESHYLESWGDCRNIDGSASIIQPLIAPLYDSRSAVEVLGLVAGELTSSGESIAQGLVIDTWRAAGLDGDFDAAWRKALHDGIATTTSSAAPPSTDGVATAAATIASNSTSTEAETEASTETEPVADGLEVVFNVSRSVYDGRFANNGWLQELADPLTKIVWDNAALVSPATAEELGIEDGQFIKISADGRSISLPAWIQPGQADGSIALELGYGRKAAGRVGNDVGSDINRLRSSASPWRLSGAIVVPTGWNHDLVQTQEHWSMEGRDLVREATVDEYHADHHIFSHVHGPPLESLWEEKSYDEGYQWAMAIDLSSCTGCNACVIACQSENNIPIVGPEQVSKHREMHWLRIDRYFSGDENDPETVFQPVPCMHCENAPCEQVCPVAATVHDDEGLNAMVYNRCIGTRYCSNNCPYKVRRFNFFNYTKDTPEVVKLAMNPDVTVRSRGVMEKCTYCVQRLTEAKKSAKMEDREVVDGEARTACQQTCPADAITFGNLNDPESAVNRAKGDDRNYVLLAEMNNKPRTSFLGKLRNPNPDWPASAASAAHGSDAHSANGSSAEAHSSGADH